MTRVVRTHTIVCPTCDGAGCYASNGFDCSTCRTLGSVSYVTTADYEKHVAELQRIIEELQTAETGGWLSARQEAYAVVERVRAQREKWRNEVLEYPYSDIGRAASVAVKLCGEEIDQALEEK